MNKILLVITFLAVGAGAFHSAHQRAIRIEQKVQSAHVSWQNHTQQLAVAQSEQAALTERIRELKQALAQSPRVTADALWSALQTNRVDRLPPELRQRALAELGFDWRTSPDYILVSKQTVRDLQIEAIRNGELTDLAAKVFALTPEERDRVSAAFPQAKTALKDWVQARVERHEPAEEALAHFTLPGDATLSGSLSNSFARRVSKAVGPEQAEQDLASATVKTLAHYTLPQDPKMSQTINDAFAAAMANAVGRERAELILPSAEPWMQSIGAFDCDAKPGMISVRRFQAGNVQQLVAVYSNTAGPGSYYAYELFSSSRGGLPRTFQPIFPNGWPDVAARESFELPPPPEKK
jgi:hypothetical protein